RDATVEPRAPPGPARRGNAADGARRQGTGPGDRARRVGDRRGDGGVRGRAEARARRGGARARGPRDRGPPGGGPGARVHPWRDPGAVALAGEGGARRGDERGGAARAARHQPPGGTADAASHPPGGRPPAVRARRIHRLGRSPGRLPRVDGRAPERASVLESVLSTDAVTEAGCYGPAIPGEWLTVRCER